jgi:competence protein CoiA
MRYALVEEQREEARPHSRGVCPHCSNQVIAKCGGRRVWHWAHFGKRACDTWWQPETDWHRGWKDHFPNTWQEVRHDAPDGERHIADVKTPHGLIIEFQHSFLDQQERLSREAFYRNMVWMVDGTRRKLDRKRFFGAIARWQRLSPDVFVTRFVDEGLPAEWLNCSVRVYFDFGSGNEPGDPFPIVAPVVWCLVPQRAMGNAIIVAVSKDAFVDACRTRAGALFDDGKLVDGVTTHICRQRIADRQRLDADMALRLRLKSYYKKQSRPYFRRF